MAGLSPLPEGSQIGRELDYFRRFYEGLRPAVYLCYDRSAWFSSEDPDFRATFDNNIRWRREDMSLCAPEGGETLLLPSQSLFEVKTADAIPLWLVEALDAGGIRQASFSKYGEAYKAICMERLGVTCA
jgi:SPX domain protein involved in polyphosphate accumulation